MKFYLALLTTFFSFALSAQTLVFDRENVSLDTVPCTFTNSGGWIWKHRQVRVWCSVQGNDPVSIDSVYEWSGKNRWLHHKSNWNAWPDVCNPGKSYEILLDVGSGRNYRYEFVTTTGQRLFVNTYGVEPGLNSTIGYYTYNYESEQEGLVHESVREYLNTSMVPVTVDSVVAGNKDWSVETPFPFVLKPGEKKSIRFRFRGKPMVSSSDNTLYFYVFHRRQNCLTDMVQGTVYLGFYHAVMITGVHDHNFGKVKNGDTLRAEFQVKNKGTSTFNLKKNARPGITFTKDSLKPGETTNAKVTWVAAAASDSFRIEFPLFNDVQNGHCTAVFHGIEGKHVAGQREKSVSPDSMIWVEGRTVDLDTVYKSQGQLEYKIKLKNNSSSPIVVTQATTGDGGSMAEYAREPIKPGEEFTVRFIQDLHGGRTYINRAVYIQIRYLGDPGALISKVVTITAVVVDDTAD